MFKRVVRLSKGKEENSGWKTKGCSENKHSNCNSLKCTCDCHESLLKYK
jgi:hypothetical protein